MINARRDRPMDDERSTVAEPLRAFHHRNPRPALFSLDAGDSLLHSRTYAFWHLWPAFVYVRNASFEVPSNSEKKAVAVKIITLSWLVADVLGERAPAAQDSVVQG
jgi:hypothetical protein